MVPVSSKTGQGLDELRDALGSDAHVGIEDQQDLTSRVREAETHGISLP